MMLFLVWVLVVICVAGLVFCVVMLLRNTVVYEARMKVLDELGFESYQSLRDYNKMMWDFTCWTKKQHIAKAT